MAAVATKNLLFFINTRPESEPALPDMENWAVAPPPFTILVERLSSTFLASAALSAKETIAAHANIRERNIFFLCKVFTVNLFARLK